jgi:two-component system phosphate regulon sensor histidine kinase PhoR
VSKRNAILIAAAALLLAAVLLLPSFPARAFAAAITLVAAVILLAKTLSTRRNDKKLSVDQTEQETTDAQSAEVFALGKLFEATMSGMREGLLVVDKDMRVVASNPAAHRLFNLSGGKLNSQRLTELTRNPALYSAFLDALKGTERSGVKVETHGPERLIFDLRVVPLNSSNGIPTNRRPRRNEPQVTQGALGVFIDVTRIERLERVRQEFLSNVSHELRTPLTAILAFVETLETSAIEDQESAKRFLAIIRKNAARMNTLIGDILELSAIESGNVEVRAEEVALAPIVAEVISALAAQAEARAITVVNDVTIDARVFADPRRLEQMLTNLIDNAIKFNRPKGEVTIRFETGGGRGSSPRVSKGFVTQAIESETLVRDKIIVQDTGEGIPAQYLDRLFERFYRADRARSREMGGTGLGLAIVKHLARAHGGEVTVTSELGKGSTFVIELPRR